jgi:hypothetical protein
MAKPIKPARAEVAPIASLDELYSIANVLGHNMVELYKRLAGEMKTDRNNETAQVFEDLATQEIAQNDAICAKAGKAGANIDSDVEAIWLERNFMNDQSREIADNPFLMTPYRAVRLAVINKEQAFDFFSNLSANQDNDAVHRHAESLARAQLSKIAELRLRRRRASRSEIKTVIDKAGLGIPPVELDNFNKTVLTVNAIIRSLTLVVRDSRSPEMTGETKQVLQKLVEDLGDFSDDLMDHEDREAFDAKVKLENENLFSSLKSLLRELESSVDLFLGYAESTNSEQVVHAAQTEAERYVHRIAKIRDELNSRV